MNNLIYRDQAIEAISELPVKVDNLGYTWMIAGDVLKQIDDIPSAELKERTVKVDGAGFGLIGHCECGTPIMSGKWKYCPLCGCKLDWNNDE